MELILTEGCYGPTLSIDNHHSEDLNESEMSLLKTKFGDYISKLMNLMEDDQLINFINTIIDTYSYLDKQSEYFDEDICETCGSINYEIKINI